MKGWSQRKAVVVARQRGFALSELRDKDNTAKMLRKLGVHLNTSFRQPTDGDVSKGRSYGVSVGLSPGQSNGWRYPVSLNDAAVSHPAHAFCARITHCQH